MRYALKAGLAGTAFYALAAAGPAAAQTAPSPAALALARQLVAKVEPDPQQTVAAMSGPMVGMIQQMGVQQPDRAQAVVQEAVMPVLSEHMDSLIDQSARNYAQVLTEDDLKATIAFYDTKAGQDMIRAQPTLARLRVQGVTEWMGTLQPEIQTRIAAMMKQHGWDKG